MFYTRGQGLLKRRLRCRAWLLNSIATLMLTGLSAGMAWGQDAVPPAAEASAAADRPLPDIPALMHEVEAHQRAAEAVEKDYMYHSATTMAETDGHGGVKKLERREFDTFWVNGVQVRRLTSKDGRPVSGDELKKENERIDKEAAKARERREKADAAGKETDPRGDDVVTVSRILELGSFTHARRLQINGRDTIAVDYAGDPKAKTRNRMEDVIRDMVGTVWVDENDKILTQAEGRFLNAFKIGGGLLVNIQKGTSFHFEQRKVNGEVWLPARAEAQGSARAMLFFSFNGNVHVSYSEYRKFKATSTILPGVGKVEETPQAGGVAP